MKKIIVAIVLSLFSLTIYSAWAGQNGLKKTASVNEPSISMEKLLVWANEAIVTVYSYNFVNYKTRQQKASNYFTPEGWKAYKEALDKSGNLDAVKKDKMVVSAVATGSPIVLQRGMLNDKYTWRVQMPALVTYQSAKKIKKQNVVVTMSVVRTSKYVGTRGLGIEQFSVKVQEEGQAAE